jgi:hypothetical protein
MADQLSILRNIKELTINDQTDDQPQQCRVQLKRHQLTLIYACRKIESQNIIIQENEQLKTKIGIIGDKVGSGKSYVIISLCVSPINHNNEAIYTTHAGNLVTRIQQLNEVPYLNSNVIVIPHNLLTQWKTYIETFDPAISYISLSRSKHIDDMKPNDFKNNKIILITNTVYNQFCMKCYRHNYAFSRVFIDEVDNIKIPACQQLSAGFYWLVTASIKNLIWPQGLYNYNNEIHRYLHVAKGLKYQGFIKDIFTSLAKTKNIIPNLIVKNTDTFVDISLNLPAIQSHFIKCKTPYTVSILNQYVNNNIIRCLNAHDYKGALQLINPSQKESEDNIIKQIIDKYEKQLHNLNVRLDYLEQIIFDSPADKDRLLLNINKEKDEVVKKIESIKNRIKESTQCPICYDEIQDKTIMKCCQNSFCFKCLTTWLKSHMSCPYCKSGQYSNINELLIIHKGCDEASMEVEPSLKTKFEKTIDIIMEDINNRRFLVLSEFDDSLNNLERLFNQNSVKFEYLKGAQNVIDKKIQKYNDNEINVLLINPQFYGGGMNLQNTTDIIMFHKFDAEMEKQVIGRAQRLGRDKPLNIWYLLNNVEVNI